MIMVRKMVGYSKFPRIYRPFRTLRSEHVVLRKSMKSIVDDGGRGLDNFFEVDG